MERQEDSEIETHWRAVAAAAFTLINTLLLRLRDEHRMSNEDLDFIISRSADLLSRNPDPKLGAIASQLVMSILGPDPRGSGH
ncbi:MAG: hypothetical protein A3E78_11850 [Alphaproteobacteria bacterium RIFCSPHIGHO2_12_FULL_63_12]|nr:MAG: hypothetical protein A3E78_11850 [Alphaproteobacteria bacterium RIFCSPHIGHO2_12_FULL_63_12]